MIGLYRGHSILSRAIQFQSRSPYSHAAWIFDNQSVVEAWIPDGVRYSTHFCKGHTPGTVIELFDFIEPLTEAEHSQIAGFLMGQRGRRYDYLGVLKFLSRRRATEDDSWFCSELVFAACLSAGRRLLSGVEPWRVYPGMLAMSPLLKKVDQVTTWKMDKPAPEFVGASEEFAM
jgi:uncharacterized protein YycO